MTHATVLCQEVFSLLPTQTKHFTHLPSGKPLRSVTFNRRAFEKLAGRRLRRVAKTPSYVLRQMNHDFDHVSRLHSVAHRARLQQETVSTGEGGECQHNLIQVQQTIVLTLKREGV